MKISEVIKAPKLSLDTTSSGTIYSITSGPETQDVVPQDHVPEKIVAEEDLNYIDAILHYCDTNSLEIESITKLISKPLKERLKWDATRLNFMKATSKAKLPL